MVSARRYIAFALLLACSLAAGAQVFPVTDTVTEYRHKGTFYHDKFEGRKTASGEIFDQNGFTAAHWKIKLGTYALVTNQNNGLQVIVKINDRCPKHGVLDLSHRAATAIGIRGCQPVTVRLLPAGYEERCLAQDAVFDSVYSRLNPAPDKPQEPVAEAIVVNEEPKHTVTVPHKKHEDACYRLILCNVASHGESFAKIQLLPELYRDKVRVETLEDSEDLQLYIDLSLKFAQAEELCRALRRNFPEARLAACP